MSKYWLKKWPQGVWALGVYGQTGVIGFRSFYAALEHIKWTLRRERQQREGKP